MPHHQSPEASTVAVEPADLASWDWLAELRAQERSIPWLARRTDRAQQTVYNYATGKAVAPIEWLKSAAAILRKDAS